uniref:Autophagy-related protein 9 n=1 Tax=Steinernema glaseri TaxID=37863 RepID=A0A1I8AQD5_9BILA
MGTLVAALGIFGGIIAICRPFISDENKVFSPQHYMAKIIAHLQYAPTGWKDNAHTDE